MRLEKGKALLAAAAVILLVWRVGASRGTSGAVSPAPTLTSIEPVSAIAGAPGFIMTVRGANFAGDSVIRWNGLGRSTTFTDANVMRAWIKKADIAAGGIVSVTVFEPGALGRISNPLPFTIRLRAPAPLDSR